MLLEVAPALRLADVLVVADGPVADGPLALAVRGRERLEGEV